MHTPQNVSTNTHTTKQANISTAPIQTSATPVSQTSANAMPATANAVRTKTGSAAGCSQPMETNVNASTTITGKQSQESLQLIGLTES